MSIPQRSCLVSAAPSGEIFELEFLFFGPQSLSQTVEFYSSTRWPDSDVSLPSMTCRVSEIPLDLSKLC